MIYLRSRFGTSPASQRARALIATDGWQRGRELSVQIASTLGTRVLVLLFTFAVNVLAARALGPEERGELALMILLPGLASTFTMLGFDASNLYFGGASVGNFRWVCKVSLVYSIVAGTLVAISLYGVGKIWPVLGLGLDDTQVVLALSLTPVLMLGALLGNAEAARGRVNVYNIISAVAMGLYFVGVLVLGLTSWLSAMHIFFIFGSSHIFAGTALSVTCRLWKKGHHRQVGFREYTLYGLRAYLLNVTQYSMLRINTPMLQILATTAGVGLYAVAYPITESLFLLTMAINFSLVPRIAKSEFSRKSLLLIALVTLGFSIVGSIVLGMSAPFFVPFVFGSEYRESVTLLWILLPGFSLYIFGRVFQTYFSGRNLFSPSILSATLALSTLVISGYYLIPRYEAVGAAWALSMSCAVFAVTIFQWFLRYREGEKGVSWGRATRGGVRKTAS